MASFLSTALAIIISPLTMQLSTSELTVVEVAAPQAPDLSLLLMVYSGSADDPAGKEGLAHLTAHLMRREAAGRAGTLAGSLGVSVGKDAMAFTAASRDEVDRLIEIVGTMVVEPVFDAAMLETERAEQKRALEAGMQDPVAIAKEAFDAFVFRGHPYAHPAAGRLSSLERITREDVIAFHATHFRKGNLAIGLSGKVTTSVSAGVRQRFARLADGTPSRPARPLSWLPRPRLVVVETPGTAVLMLGHPLNVTRAHPDYFALKVLSSRLDAEVEMVDATAAAAGTTATPLPRRRQAFVRTIQPAQEDVPAGLRLALDEIRNAVTQGWTAPQLEEARQTARKPPDPPSRDALPELIARLDEMLLRAPGFTGRYTAGLDAVTLESLRDAVTRGILPGRVAIIAIVPDAKAFIETVQGPTTGLTRDDIEIVPADSLFR